MRIRYLTVLIFVTLCFMLEGCGQSGRLYLPAHDVNNQPNATKPV